MYFKWGHIGRVDSASTYKTVSPGSKIWSTIIWLSLQFTDTQNGLCSWEGEKNILKLIINTLYEVPVFRQPEVWFYFYVSPLEINIKLELLEIILVISSFKVIYKSYLNRIKNISIFLKDLLYKYNEERHESCLPTICTYSEICILRQTRSLFIMSTK